MLVDVHCHSTATEGATLSAREALQRAKALGLGAICFTDRGVNVTAAYVDELRALGREEGVTALVGVEVETDRGHFLCFLPDPNALANAGWKGADEVPAAAAVTKWFAALGGLVIAAHPYAREAKYPLGDFLFALSGVDAVEVVNGRLKPEENTLALEAAVNLELSRVGGSGALAAGEVGGAVTLFKAAVSSESELIQAVKGGETWAVEVGGVVNGPDREPRSFRGRRGDSRRRDGGGGRGRGGRDRGRRDDREGRYGGRGGGRGRGGGGGGGGRGRDRDRWTHNGDRAPAFVDDNVGNVAIPGDDEPLPVYTGVGADGRPTSQTELRPWSKLPPSHEDVDRQGLRYDVWDARNSGREGTARGEVRDEFGNLLKAAPGDRTRGSGRGNRGRGGGGGGGSGRGSSGDREPPKPKWEGLPKDVEEDEHDGKGNR